MPHALITKARQSLMEHGGTPGRFTRQGLMEHGGTPGRLYGLVGLDLGRRWHPASTPMDLDRPDLASGELCRPAVGPRQRRTLGGGRPAELDDDELRRQTAPKFNTFLTKKPFSLKCLQSFHNVFVMQFDAYTPSVIQNGLSMMKKGRGNKHQYDELGNRKRNPRQ